VIREVAGGSGGGGTGLVFPMLKRGDYTNWAMVMEVNMQAASLWDTIEDIAISPGGQAGPGGAAALHPAGDAPDADKQRLREGRVGGHSGAAPRNGPCA
jgi:hypothetical protein